jgi:thiol:disulfide interchange protein
VPKAGPGSDLLKQVLGLLMIAVAVFFIGVGLDPKLRAPVDPAIRFHWWIMAAVVVGAMGWMVYRLGAIKVNPLTRGVLTVGGLALAVGMVVVTRSVTDRGPINWVGYTPEREEAARKAGKVVVVDFTAEWCLNCKSLEAAVLHRDEVVKALNDPSVAAFRVDLTGENAAGKAKLKSLNWVGIPLLTISGPGAAEPAKFDTYTQQVVLEAMAKAGFKNSVGGSGGGGGGAPKPK